MRFRKQRLINWIEVIGLVAAACTTISFLPQVIKVVKTRNTKDLSLSMYGLMVVGVLLWLIYGILINSLPMMICNTVTLILAIVILAMKIIYK